MQKIRLTMFYVDQNTADQSLKRGSFCSVRFVKVVACTEPQWLRIMTCNDKTGRTCVCLRE